MSASVREVSSRHKADMGLPFPRRRLVAILDRHLAQQQGLSYGDGFGVHAILLTNLHIVQWFNTRHLWQRQMLHLP